MWSHNALLRPHPQAGCINACHTPSMSAPRMATSCTMLSQRLLLQPTHTSGPQAPPARLARADLLAPKAMAAAALTLMDGFLQEAVVGRPRAGSSKLPSSSPTSRHGPGGQHHQQQQQAPPPPQRWRVLSSSPLAGGVLHVVQWEGPRNIRVWTPPGYSKEEGQRHPWPVLYCNDGQNLFGDCKTLSGHSWCVAQTAAGLITSGRLPPFLVVGLDHAGPLRSLEYTPCTPGTGPGGFRSDAAQWPGGGVSSYLARLQQEVLPWVAQQYGASLRPQDLALAGSSFGGVAALAAGMSSHQEGGCAFGALLVESPSMWIGDEAFLRDIQTYRGSWPQRVYVGMGGKEYSGVRSGRGREHDAHFPRYLKSLYAALTEQGLGPDRLAWSYDPSAAHTESAWAERLPEALAFVGQGWWANWLRRHSGSRLLTSPGQLVAGVEGQLLFFNRSASSSLRNTPRGRPMKVTMGVDGWQQAQQLQLEPLQTGLHHHIDPPAALQQEVFEAWGLDPGLQDQLHQRLLDTVKGSKATAAAAAAAGGDAEEDWCVLRLPAPPQGCSRLDMAFCDEDEKVWDNNDRQDWHLAVTQGSGGMSRGAPATGRGGSMVALAALTATTDNSSSAGPAAATSSIQSITSRAASASGPAATVLKMLDSLRVCAIGDGCGFISASGLERAEQQVLHGANTPAQDAAAAAEAAGQLMFTMPQQPVAGLPVSLYINKAALQDLIKRGPNMCLQVGFNDWSIGVQKVPFRPTSLSRNDRNDWWCCRVEVPPEGRSGAFAICGVFAGNEHWDNNQGANYQLPVLQLEAAVVRAVAGACMSQDMADGHAGSTVKRPADKLQQMTPAQLVFA